MDDKDTDKLFGDPNLLICDKVGEMKSIGKVVECASIPQKNSFSFDFKMKKEDFEILMRHPRVIALAERCRKDINSLIEAYGSLKRCGKLNRRERRAREREIKKKYGRFVTFCAQNHIQYDIQK